MNKKHIVIPDIKKIVLYHTLPFKMQYPQYFLNWINKTYNSQAQEDLHMRCGVNVENDNKGKMDDPSRTRNTTCTTVVQFFFPKMCVGR
jgi:hypothetical protein